jgi:hypothetical protein
MRHAKAAVVCSMLVAGLVVAGCGDSAGVGDEVIPSPLVGTWESGLGCHPTCALTLTMVANPAATFNVTQATALNTEIRIQRDGRFTLTYVPSGGQGPEVGSARVEGTMLIVTSSAGVVDTLDYVVSSSVLDLQFRSPVLRFDFTGDGVNDPAYMRLISVRRP